MSENIFKVNEQDKNIRLDIFVSSLNLNLSRSMCKKLINANKIFVNGENVKEAYKTKKGDIIKVVVDKPKETKLQAQEIPLNIVYEDNDIIVVNKQKGMVVHPRKWK